MEGLEAIQRSGDVLVGTKQNTSVRVFDVQVQVGPIKIVVKESADVPVSKPNVTSPVLYARLRLLVIRLEIYVSEKKFNFKAITFLTGSGW